ncbi:methyl-accepting chemotaxis protein [Marinobacter segnicrescens]|uniref:Methyl-accepting chemotaxis protein n=1 Tax=Marinobacter segnicrescens TaxID=430453 RepID=A0A1H9ZRE3_9GAMM|nr:methyl-accepting chemotaxis protein [Marinobacter segnicrescens]SES83927.1 methyl-accepting chemotaxis protein [Marinobacter segnicrescens]
MKRLLSLSWRQKFGLLIAATLVGLVLVALAALRGLDQVSESYEDRSSANRYQNASLTLWGEWLRVETLSNGLEADAVERYQQQLSALENQAEQLVTQAGAIYDEGIQATAAEIREQVSAYVTLRRQWLEQREALGLNPSSGIHGELTRAMDEGLRQISISIMNDDIELAMTTYSDYLNNFTPESAEQTHQAIDGMEETITNMDWGDNDLGLAVKAFAGAFERAEDQINAIIGTEQQLASLGSELEAVIERQNQSLETGLVASTTARAEQARDASAWLVIIVSGVVLVVLVVTLTQASRTLVGRLKDAATLLSRVAAGDLSERLQIGRNPNDEFNALGGASNQMVDDVSGVIREVLDGNRDLARLQDELQQLVRQMSSNSEQVEAQTEQAAAAVQEISHTASDIAKLTNTVNQSTQQASEAASHGATVVRSNGEIMQDLSGKIRQTHEQVKSLSKTGEKVNTIVDTINGLAEQTNLLALNAAIEAARAGEAGRGFSVVADEVRSLAEKTVSATAGIADIVDALNRETREIGALMEQGLQQANSGEESAGEAVVVIEKITQSIQSLASDMEQVVSSVEGISTTTEEIAQKVEHIHGSALESRTIRGHLEDHTRALGDCSESLNQASSGFRLA